MNVSFDCDINVEFVSLALYLAVILLDVMGDGVITFEYGIKSAGDNNMAPPAFPPIFESNRL